MIPTAYKGEDAGLAFIATPQRRASRAKYKGRPLLEDAPRFASPD